MACRTLGRAALVGLLLLGAKPALAQSAPPGPPPPAPPPEVPPPAASPPNYGGQPPPTSTLPPPPMGSAPPLQPQPQPGYGQQGYGQQGYGQPPPPGYSGGYAGGYAPPPPQNPDRSFQIPSFSVRLDPVRWLLRGEIGLELEVELWEFISLALTPAFLVDTQPPFMNDFDGVLSQHSNGIGALTGASIGVGFWLSGEPFRGMVIRGMLTNYGRTYRTKDALGTIDEVSHTERVLYGFWGSYSRFGPFIIGAGIGLGTELNDERRCFTEASVESATVDCDDEQLSIALDRDVTETAGLNSSTHPIQFIGQISLGFVF